MRLDSYTTGSYSPGAPLLRQLGWWFIGQPIVASYLLPFSAIKVFILRFFGARLGAGVRVKPGLRVKFPWRLEVGDHTWLGECAWIDNLADVSIGSHCCISQSVFLCTGNHRWDQSDFALTPAAIKISDHVWLAANSTVGPGVEIAEGAVLTLGSVCNQALQAWSIHSGNPAQRVGERKRR